MIRVGIATCSPFASFGFELIEELKRRGIEPVVMFAGPLNSAAERGYRLKNSPRVHPIRLMKHGISDDRLAIYKRFGGELVFLKRHFNHPDCVKVIQEWKLDLLLNAGGPIYRRKLIDGCGATILNCHMGLLPEIRGMNVAEWSVYRGYPIGNTVHIIRPGIDTGEIGFFFEEDPAGVRNVDELREALASQNSAHLATVVEAYANGAMTFVTQARKDGVQYYRMHDRLKELVNKRLEAGYAPSVSVRDRSYVRPARG